MHWWKKVLIFFAVGVGLSFFALADYLSGYADGSWFGFAFTMLFFGLGCLLFYLGFRSKIKSKAVYFAACLGTFSVAAALVFFNARAVDESSLFHATGNCERLFPLLAQSSPVTALTQEFVSHLRPTVQYLYWLNEDVCRLEKAKKYLSHQNYALNETPTALHALHSKMSEATPLTKTGVILEMAMHIIYLAHHKDEAQPKASQDLAIAEVTVDDYESFQHTLKAEDLALRGLPQEQADEILGMSSQLNTEFQKSTLSKERILEITHHEYFSKRAEAAELISVDRAVGETFIRSFESRLRPMLSKLETEVNRAPASDQGQLQRLAVLKEKMKTLGLLSPQP